MSRQPPDRSGPPDPRTPDDIALDHSALDRYDQQTLDRLYALSYALDNAIRLPGTNRRIGLDPLLGVLPVVGETAGSILSAYIIAEAIYLGVPRETLYRMLFNVAVDSVGGSVPIAGDVFDAAWKANYRNVQLLDARVEAPEEAELDRRYLLLVVGVLVLLLLAISLGSLLLVAWLLVQLDLF